jgi:hypothetical protein
VANLALLGCTRSSSQHLESPPDKYIRHPTGLLGSVMKDVAEVLRTKEEEFLRVKKEVEALKIAVRLLDEQEKPDHKHEYRQMLQLP